MAHHFETSQEIEARWAPVLDAWLGERYALRSASMDEQWRGMDRVTWDDDGMVIALDYKCDQRAAETGNVFIETVSNATTGRPGWALTSEAEWIVYLIIPDRVLMFLTARLRAELPTWRRRFRERDARNDRYVTKGLCVPIWIAVGVAEYVAYLPGDAAVLQPRDAS